jgi:hypothetical protein
VLAVLAVVADDLPHIRDFRQTDDEPLGFNQRFPLSPRGERARERGGKHIGDLH